MSELETKNRTLAVNLQQREADFKQKVAAVEVSAQRCTAALCWTVCCNHNGEGLQQQGLASARRRRPWRCGAHFRRYCCIVAVCWLWRGCSCGRLWLPWRCESH